MFRVWNADSIFKFWSVTKVDTVAIEDTGKQFTTGEGNKDITISIGNDKKVINNLKNLSVRFISIQSNDMTVNSPYQHLMLEFKLDNIELYQGIQLGESTPSSKKIYYKLTSAIAKTYSFSFTLESSYLKRLRYNVGIGDLTFILKPLYKYYLDYTLDFLFDYNPYLFSQPLLSNEFIYFSFEVPTESYIIEAKIEKENLLQLKPKLIIAI